MSCSVVHVRFTYTIKRMLDCLVDFKCNDLVLQKMKILKDESANFVYVAYLTCLLIFCFAFSDYV